MTRNLRTFGICFVFGLLAALLVPTPAQAATVHQVDLFNGFSYAGGRAAALVIPADCTTTGYTWTSASNFGGDVSSIKMNVANLAAFKHCNALVAYKADGSYKMKCVRVGDSGWTSLQPLTVWDNKIRKVQVYRADWCPKWLDGTDAPGMT